MKHMMSRSTIPSVARVMSSVVLSAVLTLCIPTAFASAFTLEVANLQQRDKLIVPAGYAIKKTITVVPGADGQFVAHFNVVKKGMDDGEEERQLKVTTQRTGRANIFSLVIIAPEKTFLDETYVYTLEAQSVAGKKIGTFDFTVFVPKEPIRFTIAQDLAARTDQEIALTTKVENYPGVQGSRGPEKFVRYGFVQSDKPLEPKADWPIVSIGKEGRGTLRVPLKENYDVTKDLNLVVELLNSQQESFSEPIVEETEIDISKEAARPPLVLQISPGSTSFRPGDEVKLSYHISIPASKQKPVYLRYGFEEKDGKLIDGDKVRIVTLRGKRSGDIPESIPDEYDFAKKLVVWATLLDAKKKPLNPEIGFGMEIPVIVPVNAAPVVVTVKTPAELLTVGQESGPFSFAAEDVDSKLLTMQVDWGDGSPEQSFPAAKKGGSPAKNTIFCAGKEKGSASANPLRCTLTATHTWSKPSTGDGYLVTVVASDGKLETSQTVKIKVEPLRPDLAIVFEAVEPASPVVGEKVFLKGTVTNKGKVEAKGAQLSARFTLPAAKKAEEVSLVDLGSFDPGETRAFSFPYVFSGVGKTSVQVLVALEVSEIPQETLLDNNQSVTKTIEVKKPLSKKGDPVITVADAPGEPVTAARESEPFSFVAIDQNGQSLSWSVDWGDGTAKERFTSAPVAKIIASTEHGARCAGVRTAGDATDEPAQCVLLTPHTWSASSTDAGYVVTVTVSDGEREAQKSLRVQVAAIPNANFSIVPPVDLELDTFNPDLPNAKDIKMTQPGGSLTTNSKRQLAVTGTESTKILWGTSDEDLATVDSAGMVTAHNYPGKVTITATIPPEEDSKEAKASVTFVIGPACTNTGRVRDSGHFDSRGVYTGDLSLVCFNGIWSAPLGSKSAFVQEFVPNCTERGSWYLPATGGAWVRGTLPVDCVPELPDPILEATDPSKVAPLQSRLNLLVNSYFNGKDLAFKNADRQGLSSVPFELKLPEGKVKLSIKPKSFPVNTTLSIDLKDAKEIDGFDGITAGLPAGYELVNGNVIEVHATPVVTLNNSIVLNFEFQKKSIFGSWEPNTVGIYRLIEKGTPHWELLRPLTPPDENAYTGTVEVDTAIISLDLGKTALFGKKLPPPPPPPAPVQEASLGSSSFFTNFFCSLPFWGRVCGYSFFGN